MASRSFLIRHDNKDRRYTVTINLLERQDKRRLPLTTPIFSPEQTLVMEAVKEGIDVQDANIVQQVAPVTRFPFSTGPPGCGKTEVVVHAGSLLVVQQVCSLPRIVIACLPMS
eukprot:8351452-Karenia_brevis.AAC.1